MPVPIAAIVSNTHIKSEMFENLNVHHAAVNL